MAAQITELEAEWLALERESEDLELQVQETIKENEEIREKQIAEHKKWVSVLTQIFLCLLDTNLIFLNIEGRSEIEAARVQKWDRPDPFYSALNLIILGVEIVWEIILSAAQ